MNLPDPLTHFGRRHLTFLKPLITLGAVNYGNIFSINVGPDYAGKLRAIDVQTLRRVGAMIRNPPPLPLSQGESAKASSSWSPDYAAGKAFDGDPGTRWGAAEHSRDGWLEVDLGAPAKVGRAVIDEGGWHRIRRFALQYQADGSWQTIIEGSAIGQSRELKFPPVQARVFRLNISEALEVPTILEFQLFKQ